MINCPKCKVSWIGKKIPKDIAKYYSSTHWKREIGIDGGFIGLYDGIVALQCPDCNEYFPIDDSQWAKEMYEKFIKVKENQ